MAKIFKKKSKPSNFRPLRALPDAPIRCIRPRCFRGLRPNPNHDAVLEWSELRRNEAHLHILKILRQLFY
jgi:hypothetical protein